MRGKNIARKEMNYWQVPSKEEIDLVKGYQKQLQTLSGWTLLEDNRISYEICSAATLVGIDSSSAFKIPQTETGKNGSAERQVRKWKQFLTSKGLSTALVFDEEAGCYLVDVQMCCEAILRESNKSYFTTLKLVILACGCINSGIPFLFIPPHHEFSHYMWVYLSFSASVNFVMYVVVSSFLWVAIVDAMRRNRVASILADMLRIVDFNTKFKIRLNASDTESVERDTLGGQGDVANMLHRHRVTTKGNPADIAMHPTATATERREVEMPVSSVDEVMGVIGSNRGPPIVIPQVDVSCADNFIMWMRCRSLLNVAGRRPRFRLDVYTGVVDNPSVWCML